MKQACRKPSSAYVLCLYQAISTSHIPINAGNTIIKPYQLSTYHDLHWMLAIAITCIAKYGDKYNDFYAWLQTYSRK